MGRDRLRTYAGVIPFCKQLGHRIVGVHPIVSMDFGVLGFLKMYYPDGAQTAR